METVLDIQLKSSVEEMRLQRRLVEMSEALEKTDVKLLSVLTLTSTDQETRNDAAKRLQVCNVFLCATVETSRLSCPAGSSSPRSSDTNAVCCL